MRWTFVGRLVVVVLLLPYIAAPVYDWPVPHPFSGPSLWNPYAQARAPWRRANFHAHSSAWGGLTAGAQSEAAVIDAYRSAGYDVAGLSDYETISPLDLVPAYEHGYNLFKHHQLALGAHDVVWWDVPLWQSRDDEQYVLDRLRASTDVIALNHPARLHGYTVADVARLTGYELMEIANGRITTEDRWDAALSSGRPVWGIGGDDTHDVNDRRRFGVAWTMIAAPDLTSSAVLYALRQGHSYVVVRKTATTTPPEHLAMASLTVDGARLTLKLDGPEAVVTFTGQDGQVRQTTRGTFACYDFTAADTYIRATVQGRDLDLYLNPVVRTTGGQPTWPRASIDTWWTGLKRAALVLTCLVVLVGRGPRRSSKRGFR